MFEKTDRIEQNDSENQKTSVITFFFFFPWFCWFHLFIHTLIRDLPISHLVRSLHSPLFSLFWSQSSSHSCIFYVIISPVIWSLLYYMYVCACLSKFHVLGGSNLRSLCLFSVVLSDFIWVLTDLYACYEYEWVWPFWSV